MRSHMNPPLSNEGQQTKGPRSFLGQLTPFWVCPQYFVAPANTTPPVRFNRHVCRSLHPAAQNRAPFSKVYLGRTTAGQIEKRHSFVAVSTFGGWSTSLGSASMEKPVYPVGRKYCYIIAVVTR
jgi:hypothetical protein